MSTTLATANSPTPPVGKHPAPPCTLVIFGAAGDLTKRLLMPALYNLSADSLLDDKMKIIGVNHGEMETSVWRDQLTESLKKFASDKAGAFHTSKLDDKAWNWVADRLQYVAGEFESDDAFNKLKQMLGESGNAIFYLAVSARFFKPIAERLGKAGLLKEDDKSFRRVVIEKPFGHDYASAKDLNASLLTFANEQQIYRIDHFLGKDTVQSILAVRFANALFEAETVRDKKAEIMDAIQPLRAQDVVLGQYEQSGDMKGYRQEADVAPDSQTETYAAARVFVENWRWAGVPFYLRTGKRLTSRRTEICVQLKSVPYRLFRDTPVDTLVPNVLTLRIDPEHGTTFDFNVKVPGPVMQLNAVKSSFNYSDFFEEKANVGYETLLYDCMLGDETLFQRADGIETAWAAVEAVTHPQAGALPVHGYPAGSAGPKEADALLAADGRAWRPLDNQHDKK
jgi:glucose-6-phosphate 1-dehydrogenase